MNQKKILLVSSSFYPEISPRSYRATELAKEFCRQGHEVTVISKFRNHNYSGFLKEVPITFKMWKKPRFPTFPDFKQRHLSFFNRGAMRLLAILLEYPVIEEMFQIKKMLKTESGYDMMISFAVPYPVHWGVAWSRSEKHRIAEKWVADCGDPYMGDVLDSFRKPFYFSYLEKMFCRKADFISIPIETAKPGYYAEFHDKISVIPQGFNFDLKDYEKERLANRIPVFAYTGGFLKGIRDPELLMQYLAKINLPFKFYVYTNKPELLNKYKVTLVEKLIVKNYIPRQELMQELAKMDFLINFDNHTKLNVPSKLIDYVIAKRPVLNIDRNFNEEDILSFLKGDYKRRMILPDPDQYHIKNVSRQFLNLISR